MSTESQMLDEYAERIEQLEAAVARAIGDIEQGRAEKARVDLTAALSIPA